MVLPFTVCTSLYYLSARPSTPVLLSCGLVTAGFVVGVLLDGKPVSPAGLAFGVASSAITATHSVVIKKALDVVGGSALAFAFASNLLSAAVLAPLVLVAGEGPAVMKLLANEGAAATEPGALSPLGTFLWGSAITVRSPPPAVPRLR
jgi:GDP-fucose transporter C1